MDKITRQENFRKLLELRDDVIPFIGAGFSVPRCPQWGEFLDSYLEDLKRNEFVTEQDVDTYDALKKSETDNKFEKLADLLVTFSSEEQLKEAVGKRFDVVPDGTVAKKFELLHQAFPELKITTNFDRLIESTCNPKNPVIVKCGNRTVDMHDLLTRYYDNFLLKIHGCCKDPNAVVLTAGHYHTMYGDAARYDKNAALAQFLERVFTNNPLLFIGCSLTVDRTIMILRDLPTVRPQFAVLKRKEDENERVAENRRLARMKIKPVWIDDFPEIETVLELILSHQGKPSGKPALTDYYTWVRDNFNHLDTTNLQSRGGVVVLTLPEIFIPLFAQPPKKDGKADAAKSAEESRPETIDALIGANEKLLIEGEAGSGKTTLLKHVAWILTQKGCEIPAGLEGYLPLVIFLKDLPVYLKERPEDLYNAEEIVRWYLEKKMDNVLSYSTVETYLASGKLAFLLDGLDEIEPKYRKRLIETFCNLRHTHNGTKIVFTGRPEGVQDDAAAVFRDYHVKVDPFTMQQTEEFITLWFRYYYPATGKKTAEAMTGEIEGNEATAVMKANPLMLTAICILYNDENRLPDQRAELFKKLIENLLKRRFPETYNKVHNFLKSLAFATHTTHDKNFDKNAALTQLKTVFEQDPLETIADFHDRMEETFKEISSKSGLLVYNNGSYMFPHLSFQAFLTARFLLDTYRNQPNLSEKDAILEFIDDDWYKECVKLCIGHLSVENNDTANSIVQSILGDETSCLERKLLAVEAFCDIKESFRQKSLETKTRDMLTGMIKCGEIHNRKLLARAGELLGWLGDTRADLREFVTIEGGECDLEGIGKTVIATFEIGKYPVTNGWYEEFVNAGGYKNEEYWSEEGRKWLRESKAEYPRFWHDRDYNCPNAPIVGVNWFEAEAFCDWLTKKNGEGRIHRLPTEQEWQAAVAGKREKRRYPWGMQEDSARMNCEEGENQIGKTSAVGIFESGKTPEGVYDMAGNVWEWTGSEEGADRVLRGGGWHPGVVFCRCASRLCFAPVDRISFFGFRLSRGQNKPASK